MGPTATIGPSARLYRSSRRVKAADAASGEGEQSDKVWEIADGPLSFKSDARKNFEK